MKDMYAVIGDPIGHSMSPLIHNDAFQNENVDGYYQAFRVKKEELRKAVDGMKALNFKGFNVTVPHKVDIMNYLDEIDESAQLVGAVNTVINREGKWIGYNTDGMGFFRSIQPFVLKDYDNMNVLVIGAGGAARAIFSILAKEGFVHIDLVNRTKERAVKIKEQCPYDVNSHIFSLIEFEHVANKYDLVIQTTSIGMAPNVHEKPLSLVGKVSEQSVVADIIYNPMKTAFLKEAENLGAKTVNGVGMFVHQAAEAFQLWTNKKPNIERMTTLVFNKLKGAS
ncbi:shikimate dehydrogenase [Bacillus sp. FJAT-47783]|uniref:shikimate dehydrogenase n=1 Tax=Bacillus sp. FJAT-47783 TaxID=2922712 RepID=UPI001FADB9B0|nr:shikimate dehydrogenase [Bacillus sp. FJAT-47783]